MKEFQLIAKTFQGLESVLADEIKYIGGKNIEIKKRMVSFLGDENLMYKSNLCLRTAIRILKPIFSSTVRNENHIYNDLKNIKWEEKFSVYDTFRIDAVINSKKFTNSHFIALKCKDAIVDRFREKFDKRPSIEKENADIVINIHINENNMNVSLDTSGESLHKRGYKVGNTEAPINEVLASGLLHLCGWAKNPTDLIDPMCGSGTILIEAGMIACNIPCNINREYFCFMGYKNFDFELFNKIKDEAQRQIKNPRIKIQGFDIDMKAVDISKRNIKNSLLEKTIEVEKQNFFSSEETRNKTIIFNPPYGKRLDIDNSFYKNIGDTLKQKYTHCNVWVITSSLEGIKKLGLKPFEKIPLLNGKLDSRFINYKIY